jgi:hypothetical protein
MKITIAQKLRLFSHLPGARCIIPNSSWIVEAFPTLLRFENLVTGKKREEKLDWQGPVVNFTVEQDLEKGRVRIFGHTAQGYREHTIQEGKNPLFVEKLSLGMNKALDWELMKRRCNMAEILPVWFRLGQLVPTTGKAHLSEDLKGIFQAYFQSMLTPRLTDDDHLGIFPPRHKIAEDPLALLSEGFSSIRSLFFQEEKDVFSFLPSCAPEFHAGRFITEEVEFEWSKKLLQRVIVKPKKSRQIIFRLHKPLKSFRVRTSLKEKGRRIFSEQPLLLEENSSLFFDRFEK